MKKLVFLCFLIFPVLTCWSQTVSKTINVAVAGTLSTGLTADEKATITDLTITGNIDARDFKTMRDNIPLLANLDITTAIINAYTGTGGTLFADTSYPVNELPAYSFLDSLLAKSKVSLSNIKLPNSIVSIGRFAFSNCIGLTCKLEIPQGVIAIGRAAFSNCRGLNGNLVLPSGLKMIDDQAFYGCWGFSGELIIPEGLMSIKNKAFYLCYGMIGGLKIPDSVKDIGSYAFAGCSGFSGVLKLGTGVDSIGDFAFVSLPNPVGIYSKLNEIIVDPLNTKFASENGMLFNKDVSKLILCPQGKSGELIIPNTVSVIGNYAFRNCGKLTGSLTIPESVKIVESYAFTDCWSFTGNLVLPNSISSIGNNALENCYGLDGNLTLPNQLSKIEKNTFQNCRNLTGSVIIPSTILVIGKQSFSNCLKLTNFEFYKNLSTIEENAFANCSGITQLSVNRAIPPVCLTSFALGVDPAQCTLLVPKGSKAAYQAAQYWSVFTNVVEQVFADNTAVNDLSESALSVYGRSNEIVVAGASAGEIIQVYSLAGLLLKTVKTTSELTVIPVDKGGLYLVKVSGRVAKVIM